MNELTPDARDYTRELLTTDRKKRLATLDKTEDQRTRDACRWGLSQNRVALIATGMTIAEVDAIKVDEKPATPPKGK